MADSDVQVKFGASINGLLDGIAESQEAIEGLSTYVSGVGDSFKEVAEAIGVAFAVDKIAEFDSEFAELGERIERTSKILGESGENIQLFSLAMKMAGGDADSAGMTLNILQKNIGDAISKAGPARTAFENMGFSLEKLKSTDVVSLLFQIKERMDEAGSSAEQSALKQDYLRTVAGRQAAQFLALGMTLDEVRKLAEKTGYVMSDQMTKDASELSAETKELDSAWKGLSNTVADKVSPAYKGIIGYMTELIEKTNELISANDHLTAQDKPYDPAGMLKSFDNSGASGSRVISNPEPWERYGPQGMPLGKGQFGPSGEGPQNPLPPLDTESGAKGGGSDTRDQAAREATDTQIELSKLAFAQIVQDQDALVAQFKETEAQKIEALKAAAELQEQTEQSLLDKEAAGYARDSLAFQQVQDKKQILAAQFTLEMSKLDDQMAASNAKALQKTQAEYKSFFDTIDKSMDSMLQGVLQGTQSWQAAMAKLFDNLAISFVEDITKMLIKAAALQAVNLAGGAGGNLSNAIGAEVPRALGGTQDNASNPLTAAVTALTTALGLTSATQTAATAISQTTGTVVTGLSVATAANTTATIANTGAEGAGGGGGLFSSLLGLIPAFESGTTFAPGGLSILHPGEIVIPQAQSAALRSGGSIGGAAGAASGAQINFTVQAIDTQSGMSFLQSNAGNIASIIAGQIRNGNSSLINAVKN